MLLNKGGQRKPGNKENFWQIPEGSMGPSNIIAWKSVSQQGRRRQRPWGRRVTGRWEEERAAQEDGSRAEGGRVEDRDIQGQLMEGPCRLGKTSGLNFE